MSVPPPAPRPVPPTGYICAGTIVWDRNERRGRRIRFLSRILCGGWKR